MPNGEERDKELEWQWPWQQPAKPPEKIPTGGMTEWYKGLKERGEEELAWLLPQLSRKEYEEGLEIYLARMVEVGSFSEDYADELEGWAKQRIASEGVHEGLPFYSDVSYRHITPQWWGEQYQRWVDPKLAEQARIGQAQAEIATEQARRAKLRGEWQPRGWAGKPRVSTQVGAPSEELTRAVTTAEQYGVDISNLLASRNQPLINRPSDDLIANMIFRQIKPMAEAQERRKSIGWMQEQQQVASSFPGEWGEITARQPMGYGSPDFKLTTQVPWVERDPAYQALKGRLWPSEEQVWATQKAKEEREEKQRVTRMGEMWARPGRWTPARQRA